MNRKGISSIVIILIIVGILVIGGGIYWWQSNVINHFINQRIFRGAFNLKGCDVYIGGEPACDDNSSQSSGQSETANWKTYQNEKYGFEMKYPKEWTSLSEKGRELPNYPDLINNFSLEDKYFIAEISLETNEYGIETERKEMIIVDGKESIIKYFSDNPCGGFVANIPYKINLPNEEYGYERDFLAIKVNECVGCYPEAVYSEQEEYNKPSECKQIPAYNLLLKILSTFKFTK